MNRLQKKCFIGTAGIHLLLLVILLVGPAFFQPRHQPEQLHVLDVIPANLIDAQFNSGIRNAQPPPPSVRQTAPQPPAPKPEPVVAPRVPTPAPKRVVKHEIDKPTPAPKRRHEIKPNLKRVVRGDSKHTRDDSRDDSQRARALRKAIRNLKKSFSPSTMVDMPGNGTAAYANYKDVIGSIYYEAWTLPNGVSSDDANVKARIVIASDGTVVSARIITPSGDAKVDDSVRRTLERVTFIAPFPEGTTEKERPFIINFNLKTKRMLE